MKMNILKDKNIIHSSNAAYLKYMMNKKILGVDNATPNPITTPTIGTPLGALTYVKPQAIEILTAPRLADSISTPEQNGRFGDKIVSIKTKELLGKTSIDDGSANDGKNSGVNYTFANRGVYYYRADWLIRDIDEVQVASFGESLRTDNVNAAMEALAIERNKIFFEGVSEKSTSLPVYGLMNSPELDAYKTVLKGKDGAGYTFWDTKEPQEIFNDVVRAIAELNKKSVGLVNQGLSAGGRIKILTSSIAYSYLAKANNYGLSALTLLKDTYGDKIELLQVPQMANAHDKQDVMYMIFTGLSSPTIINSYVEMARFYPIFTKASETSQKISAATSGCIIQYPMFIDRYDGILKNS